MSGRCPTFTSSSVAGSRSWPSKPTSGQRGSTRLSAGPASRTKRSPARSRSARRRGAAGRKRAKYRRHRCRRSRAHSASSWSSSTLIRVLDNEVEMPNSWQRWTSCSSESVVLKLRFETSNTLQSIVEPTSRKVFDRRSNAPLDHDPVASVAELPGRVASHVGMRSGHPPGRRLKLAIAGEAEPEQALRVCLIQGGGGVLQRRRPLPAAVLAFSQMVVDRSPTDARCSILQMGSRR